MPGSVPLEFFLFACVLGGVALSQKHGLWVALCGTLVIVTYKVGWSPFAEGPGLTGLAAHLGHEWVTLANLLMLLLAFALVARTFEASAAPKALARWLPAGTNGCFVLLLLIFAMSAFLDNIAAALIGGAIAHSVFRKVHPGYLVAIVAAANGGGSGSAIGDTTTTMMWIAGIRPGQLAGAYVGSAAALLVFGFAAARQQQALSPIAVDQGERTLVDRARLGIVAFTLTAGVAVNLVVNSRFADVSLAFPFLGTALWAAIGLGALWRKPEWGALRGAMQSAQLLLLLVLCASMMPIDALPSPSWQAVFGLGLLSAVFDNIPLTALAIRQGGYDWGCLAYAVGFGGSMMWFGSSAGVAICGMYPQARNARLWLRHGWHVGLAYVVGFAFLLGTIGWHVGTRGLP